MQTQHISIRHRFISLLATTTLASLACSGGRPGLTTANGEGSGRSSALTVHLSAGTPIAGATITVYAIHDADGRVNAAVGSAGVIGTGGPTDSSGDATIALSMRDYSGPLQVIASGSNLSYIDPCSPASSGSAGVAIQIPATFTLTSFYPGYTAGASVTLPVNILTTLADHEVLAYLQGRHPLYPGTTTLAAALADRDRLFVQHITPAASAWDPTSLRRTVPAALGAGPQTLNDSALAALFDAGLSSLAHRVAVQAGYDADSTVINAITLAQLLEQDLDADATFDGRGAGGTQLRTSGSTPVSIDAQTLRLPFADALDEFIYTPAVNKSGITRIDLSNAGVYDCIAGDQSDLFGAPPAGTFVLDRIPPSVAFATPVAGATNAPLTVRVRATDTGAGISSVWVQLNGTQPEEAAATGSAGVYETRPLTLNPGPNALVAWAVDNAQTSGEGQPSPATATAQIIFDSSRPDPTYMADLASYYDERGLTVATSGSVAIVPAQYICSSAVHGCTKTAIPADLGIAKVATRLGWTAQPTAALLEGANPDNIPLLRWKVPYSPATDAPISTAKYSVAISCTGCNYPAATGDLWPSAAASTSAVSFDLPVASNLIPALPSLPSAATLAVTVTLADAAGNVATNSVSVPFHLLGPPLAVVPDGSFLPADPSGNNLASYTVSGGTYPNLFKKSRLYVYHYTVSNPHTQAVALNYPTATWTNKETWRAHRRQGVWWFSQSNCVASPGGCAISASEGGLYSSLDQWPLCADLQYGCTDNGGGTSRYFDRTLKRYSDGSAGLQSAKVTNHCRQSADIPAPPIDWGEKMTGTAPVGARFTYQGSELTGSSATQDYVIPPALAGTGSPSVVDVTLLFAPVRQNEGYPSEPCNMEGRVPRLPVSSDGTKLVLSSDGIGCAVYYNYIAYSNPRKGCDGTYVFQTTSYYDYQFPDEIHDEITGAWPISPRALDPSFSRIGDPAPQQTLSLNYQVPHN